MSNSIHSTSLHLRENNDIGRELRPVIEDETMGRIAHRLNALLDLNLTGFDKVCTTFVLP